MFGMIPKEDTTCPNCGAPDFDSKKKDFECPKCGFHKVATKDMGMVTLLYCEDCGCHYSNGCDRHETKRQKPIKL